MAKKKLKKAGLHLLKSGRGFHWELQSANGRILAKSGGSFTTKPSAIYSLNSVAAFFYDDNPYYLDHTTRLAKATGEPDVFEI